MDGGSHIAGVEAGEASAFPRHPVTQRDRSCAGKTTERGTITCLTGCREAVITNVARFRAPADVSRESGGSGDVHGHDTGRTARVNEEVCLNYEVVKNPLYPDICVMWDIFD